jgi:hypothetical protein
VRLAGLDKRRAKVQTGTAVSIRTRTRDPEETLPDPLEVVVDEAERRAATALAAYREAPTPERATELVDALRAALVACSRLRG